MKAEEAERLKSDIWQAICKKGMPMNIRMGLDQDAADWVKKILEKYIQIDEPVGVIQGSDYDRCPACNSVIGQSAYFCKRCGAYIRQVRK